MEKLEFYLNVFHFCFYKLDYRLSLLFNKINPFWLLTRLSFFKRRYKELGVDIHKEVNNLFENKVYGFSIMVAGGGLLLLFFILFIGFFNFIHKFFTIENLELNHFIILGILSIIVCYIFVFRNDKYMLYFDKFEKWTKQEKRKYGWLSLGFVIVVCGFFIVSFRYA